MSKDEYEKVSKAIDKLWAIATEAMRSRKYNRSIKALDTILKLDAKNGTAHNRLGIIYAKLSEYDKSIAHFQKATKLENSASSEHNLGLIYYETGKYKKSKKHLKIALSMEELAVRHIAYAKVLEKLGESKLVLDHLESAMKLEPNQQTHQIYIDAYRKYGASNKKLSKEILEAIQQNSLEWDYETMDSFPLLIDLLQLMHKNMQDVVFSKPNKVPSLRDENARGLMIAYLHNLSACIPLLSRNYSLASANIARSMLEIYLNISYGMRFQTNRGFAEIELKSINGKIKSQERIMKHMDRGGEAYELNVESLRSLAKQKRALHKKYKSLRSSPNMRQAAIFIDGGVLGENYQLYQLLYEKGSDIIHAERTSITRIVKLSNTREAGLFADSYLTLNRLIDLSFLIGDIYIRKIKDGSIRVKHKREMNSLKRSLESIRQTRINYFRNTVTKQKRIVF